MEKDRKVVESLMNDINKKRIREEEQQEKEEQRKREKLQNRINRVLHK